MRKLIYLAAVTIDGFIADSHRDTGFFGADPKTLNAIFAEYPETCPAHLREVLGVDANPRHFDAVVMGYNTHRPALEAGLTSAYPHLAQYVLTHRADLPADPTVTVVPEDPVGLVRDLKQQPGRDIWLCGGADVAAQLAGEIDEYHLKVNPVLIGAGIPLLGRSVAPIHLDLGHTRVLPAGVQLSVYRRHQPPANH